MRTCKAVRQQDQMQCGRCGLAWDVDDDDPPECLTAAAIAHTKIKELLTEDIKNEQQKDARTNVVRD